MEEEDHHHLKLFDVAKVNCSVKADFIKMNHFMKYRAILDLENVKAYDHLKIKLGVDAH